MSALSRHLRILEFPGNKPAIENQPWKSEALKRTYARNTRNRNDEVTFHMKLAAMTDKAIPAEAKEEEASSTKLAEIGSRLRLHILRFGSRIQIMEESEIVNTGCSLALAMFILERTMQIRDESLRRDSLGIFIIYVPLRDDICRMLGPSYCAKNLKEVLHEYLDIEPRIIAASKLCGFMPPPEPAKIPELYKRKLLSAISEFYRNP